MQPRRIPMRADDDLWSLFNSFRPDTPEGSDSACGHCGGTIHLAAGNYECKTCCSVIDRFIDHGAEWRVFQDDARHSDPSRCGPPNTSLVTTSGSYISSTPSAGYGKLRMVQRLQAWNAMTHRERTLIGVFDLMSVSAATFGLSQCILEQAKTLYKELTEHRIMRGESRTALIASCLYQACKANQVPRSTKEIAEMFGVPVHMLTRACRRFNTIMDIDCIKSSEPIDFVARFCSHLNLCPGESALVKYVVNKSTDNYLINEATPPSLVSAALQLVNVELDLNITKIDIANACRISPITVTKCYKRILQHRDVVLPECGALAFVKNQSR